MVFVNLTLDGYTNNQQDSVFSEHKPTPVEMMKYLNFCQFLYLALFIILQIIYYAIMCPNEPNEGLKGLQFLYYYDSIAYDVLIFCFCAAIGQLFVFLLMEEFGSLVWICISVTRKLVTVLVSVIVFKHEILQIQWLGMIAVFCGIILDSYMSYVTDKQKRKDISVVNNVKLVDSNTATVLKDDASELTQLHSKSVVIDTNKVSNTEENEVLNSVKSKTVRRKRS